MTTTPNFRALLADDAYAASFQSMGQYRTALLKALSTPPPKPLSPAAEAVLDAYWETFNAPLEGAIHRPLAAALRAVADQCKIEWNYHPDYPETESVIIVSELLAIATELEGP